MWASTPAFDLARPKEPVLPLVVSAPHSGTRLPHEARLRLCVGESVLRQLDDGPVDRLAEGACASGVVLVRARYRRAYVDLNRDPNELDPELLDRLPKDVRPLLSLRVRAGLGVIPSRLGTRRLYAAPLPIAEVRRRLERVHVPYHACLAREIEALRRRFPVVLLLDLHSMPDSAAWLDGRRIDVCIGDRFGQSAHCDLAAWLRRWFAAEGLRAAHNRPYAGGYVVARHARPQAGVHALQLELRRGLFMDERSHRLHRGFEVLQRTFARLLGDLGTHLARGGLLSSVA